MSNQTVTLMSEFLHRSPENSILSLTVNGLFNLHTMLASCTVLCCYIVVNTTLLTKAFRHVHKDSIVTTPTQVNSADDLLGAHPFGDPGPATVHQSHDVAALSACLAHDGHLGSYNNTRYCQAAAGR